MKDKRCQPHFSLRYLLAFAVGIAVLCGLREFFVAAVISFYPVLYYAVYFSGLGAATCHRAQPCKLIRPIRNNEQIFAALFTVTLCNLVVYFILHVTFVWCCRNALELQSVFFEPTFAGMSVYGMEQAILLAIHIALYLAYWGNCWTSGEVIATEVRDSTALSFLLTASHFASPWATNAVGDFLRFLYRQ